jgi:hypothetical protein
MPVKTVFCPRQSLRFGTEIVPVKPREMLNSQSLTSLSGSPSESGRSSTPSITEKMAVLAPIPKARVSTATSVKPGFFNIVRAP